MATRTYDHLAAGARAKWSPQAHEIAARLGQQLDAEITAQEALGRDLRVARESARLTQPRLAEIAAVQQAEISRVERGLGNPTRDTLFKLAGALNLRLTLAPVAPRATSGAHTV